MKPFMDKEFLLSNQAAKTLYHSYAEKLPIVDYHCHINPKDIWMDKQFENISQLWLGVGGEHFGDHYKWRLMRSCGVPEEYVSGKASDKERFIKWASCLEQAAGNPLYHWSHMELKKYFGYEGILNQETAEDVWELCNKKLRDPSLSVRGIISQSNVDLICTTDDPADTLEWHEKLASDTTLGTKVLPTIRPDKVKNIGEPAYPQYIMALSKTSGIEIQSFTQLKKALRQRMDHFERLGCRAADHAFEYVVYQPVSEKELEDVFSRRLNGQVITQKEQAWFTTGLMEFLAEEYVRRGWVMQIHYGCRRNNNTKRYREMGADTGYDCIGDTVPVSQLVEFLNSLEEKNCLPKTILYSLNPNDNAVIDSVLGCFQDAGTACKIQHGSAWWFNDHIWGMRDHLISLANQGNLSGFVGMLTDSRSFLSYTRHDYFRRILCQLLGEWVESGLFPWDERMLGTMVKNISYNNTVNYFGFPLSAV